ncbi:hypothetical protein B296_00042279 [Ensete ventricosum]|uniref:Uncharacterized protein n=1 Tax=Ensete ventricosum TaxID=4639 RepID=A0A426ZIX1_ENSVE|nr:hypothetical protein B296_00042279 [Ensete ventricosum]
MWISFADRSSPGLCPCKGGSFPQDQKAARFSLSNHNKQRDKRPQNCRPRREGIGDSSSLGLEHHALRVPVVSDRILGEAPLLGPDGLVDLLFGQIEVALELEGDPLADDRRRSGGRGFHAVGGRRRGSIGGGGGAREEFGEGIDNIFEKVHPLHNIGFNWNREMGGVREEEEILGDDGLSIGENDDRGHGRGRIKVVPQ